MSENRKEQALENEFDELEKQLEGEESFLRYFESDSKPLKILLKIYKGNYWRIIKSALFVFLKYLPVIAAPLFTASAIDLVVYAHSNGVPLDYKRLFIYFATILTLYLLNIPLNYLYVKNSSKAIRSVEIKLRNTMVRKLQQLSLSFHKEMQSGRIQSKIMRDVEAIEALSAQAFGSVIEVIFSLACTITITLVRAPSVLLIFLALIPVELLVTTMFKATIRKRNADFRHEIEKTSAAVMEMVELIPVTKAHALEDIESEKINHRLKKVASRGYALDVTQAFFGSVNWVTVCVFQIVCLVINVLMATRGVISVGDISLYQSYFSSIANNVSRIIGLLPILTKGFESVKSVGDILGAYDIEDNEGKQKVEKVEGAYEFSDVDFSYKEGEPVIKKLNLKIEKGETIALVGESGSGKSTILNMVIGFYKANGGKLTVDGLDIKDIDLQSYRSHIAVVPQSSVLFSGTIRDNITFGNPSVSERELWHAIKAANLEDMVKKMPQGLNTQVGEHGDKLSGGQRQRISIARAIIRKPDIIIFDEATSALDSVSEKLIQEAIDYLCREKTTFIVAHRLSTIRNADKIAVLESGRCVEYGTYEELMEKQGAFYKYKILQS